MCLTTDSVMGSNGGDLVVNHLKPVAGDRVFMTVCLLRPASKQLGNFFPSESHWQNFQRSQLLSLGSRFDWRVSLEHACGVGVK